MYRSLQGFVSVRLDMCAVAAVSSRRPGDVLPGLVSDKVKPLQGRPDACVLINCKAAASDQRARKREVRASECEKVKSEPSKGEKRGKKRDTGARLTPPASAVLAGKVPTALFMFASTILKPKGA